MARRFNLDLGVDLALDGYGFENSLYEGLEFDFGFRAASFPNLSPMTLFPETALPIGNTPALLNGHDDSPEQAPQQPSQPLNNSPFGAVLELSSLLASNGGDGSAGFVISGIDGGDGNSSGDGSGGSVSSAGDFNGDGFDDFIVGAARADANGNSNAGESYVIFGNANGFGTSFNLSMLNGTNGFLIAGIDSDDSSGNSVSSAGDINGDGFDDLIIGAESADDNAGESYVIFGSNASSGASFSLSNLNGANGFVINGIDIGDNSGASVSAAGDINGDNIDDFIIGATNAAPNGITRAGESYVVFGTTAGFGASLDLSSLNGTNGFVLNGIDESDSSGVSVSSAGDINGDGFDDLIIGSRRADPNFSYSGESYVVFGSNAGFGASLDLSTLDGANGFVINGIGFNDYSGGSVSSAGDINGDGFDDIIIGATQFGFYGSENGQAYVVFGAASPFSASLELSALDGTNGFAINGIDFEDAAGSSVSSAGDVNGDGFDDLIIGASAADPNGNSFSGESYLIYGKETGFSASLDLASLNGTNGFVINGISANDRVGFSVSSAGDINNDGFDDVIIGARDASPNGNRSAGETYVIYGQSSNAVFELSSLLAVNGGDGSAGFVINGIDFGDRSGISVSSAGDVNGDGLNDIIIGAFFANPNGTSSGESYVIFGRDTDINPFAASLELSALDGSNGFVLNGIDMSDKSGISVSSAGDINGDGFDDILIGARSADPNGSSSGETYIVFGRDTVSNPFAANFELSALDGTNGFVLNGVNSNEDSGTSVSSAGDINGDGFDDIIIGARHGSSNGSYAGESYIVFGRDTGTNPFAASFELSTLDGTNGFVINGIDGSDQSGASVSNAGDINGDGFDDILIGALRGSPNGIFSGESYVVFGRDTVTNPFSADIELSALNGIDGFVINGIDSYDRSGHSVSSAGDINGDGFDDIIIGAYRGAPNGYASGESYIVFGRDTNANPFAASLELSALDGTTGFVLNGIDLGDRSGISVSNAGDINGDGFDDILIGAHEADPNGDRSGESYIVFGRDTAINPFAASLDLSALDGTTGLILNGINAYDRSGGSVSSAGDINGDGFDDIIIGASYADPNGNTNTVDEGQSYVIYGSAEFGRTIEILSVAADSYTASDDGEVVHGLAGDDIINGGASSDVLIGDEGDDTLNGNAGNDRLEGGAGNDNLDGGTGHDIAVYDGSATDYDIVNNGDGTYTVTDNMNGNGVDTLLNIEELRIGTEIIDLLDIPISTNGTSGNDNLTGTSNDDFINGRAGNDILNGLAGDDIINGNEGADRLIGGEGADALNGDAGFDSADYRGALAGVRFNVDTGGTVGEATGDTFSSIERYYLSDFNDVVTGSAANEFFYGEAGNDTINGGGGIDRIYGGEGNDIQRGQEGNDTLYGSAGNDQLNGGTGFDVANYSFAAAGVTVNMLTGGTAGDAAGDTYFGIEAVYGSDFDDSLTGNNSTNELRGGDGDDMLFGLGGNDRFFGGEGADSFDGGTGTDIVNYTLTSAGVTLDLATGGTSGEAAGDSFVSIEWVFGSAFDDNITGDSANNRLEGRDGNDTLNGEAGNDRLLGGDGNDIINGGDGVDTIFGQDGDDTLSGGDGNDFFFGGAGADSHDGGAGIDTVSYLSSTMGLVIDMTGFLTTTGDAAGDIYTNVERIFGSGHDDTIIGDSGNQTLLGNGGDDFIWGGEGADSLSGGAGTDRFYYDGILDGADVITDFRSGATSSEVIEFASSGINSFAELMAIASDAGANTIFDFGGGNTLTVVGSNIDDFVADDFVFNAMPPASEMLDDADAFAAEVADVFNMDALL